MSAALSIVFTGLCALVTDGDRAPGQVLLLDTRTIGEARGIALPEHAPTLVVNLGLLANSESSNPTRVVTAWPDLGRGAVSAAGGAAGAQASGIEQIGLWDLSGSEVRIRVQGREAAGVELYRPAPGASSWPEPPVNVNDPGSWRDPRYLASMKALTGDGRIDPALMVVDDVGRTTLPRGVASRFHIDTGRIEGGVPSHEIHRDDVFEFRRAGVGPSHRQALTDTVRWTIDAEESVVVVEIVPAAGGPLKRLVVNSSGTPRTLYVSNLPADDTAHDAHHGRSPDETSFPHFAAYYELLMNKPADKPVPALWLAPVDKKGAGGVRPLFCGPAVFSRR